MKIYMNYDNESLKFKGFYIDDIHGENIPSPYINIDEGLWKYLQNLTEEFKLKEGILVKKLYTLTDKDIIETIPFVREDPKPTRIDTLEEQNALLLLDIASKDAEITELSQSQAQIILDSAQKDSEIDQLNQIVSELVLTVAQGGM